MSEPLWLLDSSIVLTLVRGNVPVAYPDINAFSQGHADGAKNMGNNDAWIAACTRAAGATLITTDRDFLHLAPELLDVEWIDPNAAVKG